MLLKRLLVVESDGSRINKSAVLSFKIRKVFMSTSDINKGSCGRDVASSITYT